MAKTKTSGQTSGQNPDKVKNPDQFEYITLVNGQKVLVDEQDYAWLSQHRWFIAGGGYATMRPVPTAMPISMHRLIMGFPETEVDHVNHNKLDNRRVNLRVVSHKENMQNLKKGRGCIQKLVSSAGNVFYRGKLQQDYKVNTTKWQLQESVAWQDLQTLKIEVLGDTNG